MHVEPMQHFLNIFEEFKSHDYSGTFTTITLLNVISELSIIQDHFLTRTDITQILSKILVILKLIASCLFHTNVFILIPYFVFLLTSKDGSHDPFICINVRRNKQTKLICCETSTRVLLNT